jgi:hypothetical protein
MLEIGICAPVWDCYTGWEWSISSQLQVPCVLAAVCVQVWCLKAAVCLSTAGVAGLPSIMTCLFVGYGRQSCVLPQQHLIMGVISSVRVMSLGRDSAYLLSKDCRLKGLLEH